MAHRHGATIMLGSQQKLIALNIQIGQAKYKLSMRIPRQMDLCYMHIANKSKTKEKVGREG